MPRFMVLVNVQVEIEAENSQLAQEDALNLDRGELGRREKEASAGVMSALPDQE